MKSEVIAVVGATGKTGSRVLAKLGEMGGLEARGLSRSSPIHSIGQTVVPGLQHFRECVLLRYVFPGSRGAGGGNGCACLCGGS